jgi:hypothetical protein
MSEFTVSDIIRFAEKRSGGLKCPICRQADFSPVAARDGKPLALLYEDSGRSWFGPPGYLRVYGLSCDHCGNLSMFNIEAIEKAMRSEKPA